MKFQQILKAGSATAVIGAALASQTAFAQEASDPTGETTPVEDAGAPIVVTGSRIIRPNLEANSPIAVVTGEETVKNADVTLDWFRKYLA